MASPLGLGRPHGCGPSSLESFECPDPVAVRADNFAFRDFSKKALGAIGRRHQGNVSRLVAEVVEVHDVVRKLLSAVSTRSALSLLDQLPMALDPSPAAASYLGQVPPAVGLLVVPLPPYLPKTRSAVGARPLTAPVPSEDIDRQRLATARAASFRGHGRSLSSATDISGGSNPPAPTRIPAPRASSRSV